VSELQGIARCKFHEDGLEEFKRLAAQAMEIVRNKADTGTLRADLKTMLAGGPIRLFTPYLSR
jgi:hypothetical protein